MSAERRRSLVAWWLALLLGACWSWWAIKSGAYFGSVFYPGALGLVVLVAIVALASPIRLSPRPEAILALALLTALASWTLLSRAWTPLPKAALDDSTQALAYAAAFALGLWLRRLSPNPLLGLLPLAIAGALAGAFATGALAGGHHLTAYLHPDASFRFPLGYRNANAAFFMIVLWPALTLAAAPGASRWRRAGALAVATSSLEIAVLSQSRGSTIAAALATVVVFAFSPWRLRLAAHLGLASLPVLVSLPVLLDVYRHGQIAGALPLLREAGSAVALSALVALVLGAVACRLEGRIHLAPAVARRLERRLGIAVLALAIAGGGAFVAAKGGPVRFVDQRVSELTKGGYPDLRRQGTRFGANIRSNRADFWRVALLEGRRRPLLGGGAESFGPVYLRERRSSETPSDPHSVEMLMLSELGLPGLLLFTGFVFATAVGVLRSRALQKPLAAAALAAGAYWLVHSSYDWFWNYPAMTAPVLCLLGAAIAPAVAKAGSSLQPTDGGP